MERGGGFAGQVARLLLAQPGQTAQGLAETLVFVPTARVAARLRGLLSNDMAGVLPAVLPLKGNGELAELLGIDMPRVCAPMAVRLELARFLKDLGEENGDRVTGARLWRRVDGLHGTLDRLGRYGVRVNELRETVPPPMAALWEMQAEVLIRAGAHMEHWLARRGEVLGGTAERLVLERAAEILAEDGCGWRMVLAGIVDGIPAAHRVARVVAAKGMMIQPGLGPVTESLIAEMGEPQVRVEGLAGRITTCVAETDWDEAWLAALAVRRAKDAGVARVGVVAASRTLLERVSAILGRWGMVVPVGGCVCMDGTPEGREVMARRRWGMGVGRPAEWLEAMAGQEVPAAVLRVLEPLREMDAWLDAEDWHEVMRLALGEAPAPAAAVSDGIVLLGPLEARLVDFDYVIVAGCEEGVWPAPSRESWLSEAHLRALGMPDSQRKALLAGTEFESAVLGGSAEVLVLRAKTVDGREVVPSRFWDLLNREGVTVERELPDVLALLRGEPDGQHEELGVFVPQGALWPKRWSASLTEALLACPYKALGERVLRLTPPDPLTPTPDARTAGLLAHRWLEKAGKEALRNQDSGMRSSEAEMVSRLLEIAEFELRHEPPVVQAVWRAKFAKLAPALVAKWLEHGRQVVAVEQRLAKEVGPVTVTATLDRVEAVGGAAGAKVIIDFKTSTPPGWPSVASGERPQLAIEAWLLGGVGEVADVEYWQLRGYGPQPLPIIRPGKNHPLERLVEPVGEGLARLVAAYGEGSPYPAVPDMAGGGLMATGHCARCELAGVCRRKAHAAVEV